MDVGLLLVPLLLLVSGVIAYVGNVVGRRIGKRRLSLFGLRPRTTAQIITVLTGVVINLVTLGAVLTFSSDARVALFDLRETLSHLEKRADALRTQIRALEQGDIALLRAQEVGRRVFRGRPDLEAVRNWFFQFRQEAVEAVTAQGARPDASGTVLLPDPPGVNWDDVARLIHQRNREVVVQLVSTRNALVGTPVPAEVRILPNELVFKKGQLLREVDVSGGTREQLRDGLVQTAGFAGRAAAEGRVLAPPGTRIGGPPFIVIDGDSGRRVTEQIIGRPGTHRIRLVAFDDTYTVGPLIVAFQLIGEP
ncbi:MAG: DUF3084 domain-containing protein [Armatimonadetes bacterium]|nr:DUF3084 domain-containing protein [Armatimonadota bacterium]